MQRTLFHRITIGLGAIAAAVVVAAAAISLPGSGTGSAATPNSVVTADTHRAGQYSSLVLDASGFPVISYSASANDSTASVRVMHCNDANCAGGDEATFTLETDDPSATSLALDSNGFPVVAMDAAPNTLRILHCNDANCAGNDEAVTNPDTDFNFGATLLPSLILDGNGFPVIAYVRTGGALYLMHCNDANCAGGD